MLGNKTNAMFVAIAALLLVAGTALPVVHADTTETDVTVEVEEDPPVITIDDRNEEITHDGDQQVTFEIYSDSEDDAVDTVELDITYDGENDIGEAVDSEESGNIYDATHWDGSGTYTDTYTFDGPDPFWRYGSWEVTATLTSQYDAEESGDYEDTESYTVQEYLVIDTAEDGTVTAQAGENPSGTDFTVPDSGDDGDTPKMTVISNAEYSIGGDGGTLDGPGADLTATVTYQNPSETPSDGETFEIHYDVNIPHGQEAGTYTGTISHTLSNSES